MEFEVIFINIEMTEFLLKYISGWGQSIMTFDKCFTSLSIRGIIYHDLQQVLYTIFHLRFKSLTSQTCLLLYFNLLIKLDVSFFDFKFAFEMQNTNVSLSQFELFLVLDVKKFNLKK